MKQVNVTMKDKEYEVLVREIGKRMHESGKLTRIGTLAYELLKPSIAKLNGDKPTKDAKQDAPPIENPETKSKLAQDFANLDF